MEILVEDEADFIEDEQAAASSAEQKHGGTSESKVSDASKKATTSIEEYDTPLGASAFLYKYEKDQDGNLILDKNGDPIVILQEGQEIITEIKVVGEEEPHCHPDRSRERGSCSDTAGCHQSQPFH